MGLTPETAVAPLQSAPADRPTLGLEEWARQGIALLFGDRRLDMTEQRILRDFMEEVAMRAQNGGIGQGATPPAGAPGELPPSPQDMNAQSEDLGTEPGAVPMDDEEE